MCQEATLHFSQLCIYMCMHTCMDMQLHGFITKHHLINKLCTFYSWNDILNILCSLKFFLPQHRNDFNSNKITDIVLGGGVEEWPYTMTFYGLPLLFKFLDVIWGFSGNSDWWTFMLCYLRVWFLRFKGIWLDFTPSSFSIKGDWVLTRIRWFWGYSPPYFRFADFLNKVVIPAPATCLSIIGLLCGEQLKLRMWTKGTMRFSSIFKDVLLFLATWCKERT